MAKSKLIKSGDRTIVLRKYGEAEEVRNRILNEEAAFAMSLIERSMVGPILPAGAAVERAFNISKLAFQHIKENRMDTPFPFSKVYLDVDGDA